jgi:hypothetical protein
MNKIKLDSQSHVPLYFVLTDANTDKNNITYGTSILDKRNLGFCMHRQRNPSVGWQQCFSNIAGLTVLFKANIYLGPNETAKFK